MRGRVFEAVAALAGLVGVEDQDPPACLTYTWSHEPVEVLQRFTWEQIHADDPSRAGEGIPVSSSHPDRLPLYLVARDLPV